MKDAEKRTLIERASEQAVRDTLRNLPRSISLAKFAEKEIDRERRLTKRAARVAKARYERGVKP